jgi:hypothetical protein
METITKVSNARFVEIKNSILEQKYQLEAIQVAYNNLEGHITHITQIVEQFKEKYQIQCKSFEDLLETHEKDLEYLKEKELHPLLQTETRKTLLDCIPEKQVKLWVPKCTKELEVFQTKVDSSLIQFEEIEKGKKFTHSSKIKILEGFEIRAREGLSLHESYLDGFKKDYEAILDVIRKNAGLSETTASKMKNSHLELIASTKAFDDKLKDMVSQCYQSKFEVDQLIRENLKEVSEKQYQITKIGKKVITYGSILNTLAVNFSHLEMIKCFPGAYYLSLMEITRRRKFGKMYKSEVIKCINNMAMIREEEVAKRRKFQKNVGKFIPNGFIDGLNDYLPSFEIDTKVLETNLPSIDFTMDRSLFKSDLEKIYKNSFKEEDLNMFEVRDVELHRKMETSLPETKESMMMSVKPQNDEIQRLKEKIIDLETNLEMEKSKSSQLNAEFGKQKEFYNNTVNELVETVHEVERLSQENVEYKKSFKMESSQDLIKKENQELKEMIEVKEKLRHEAIMNSAHSEKKLFNMTKELQKYKASSKMLSDKMIAIAKLYGIEVSEEGLDAETLEKIVTFCKK